MNELPMARTPSYDEFEFDDDDDDDDDDDADVCAFMTTDDFVKQQASGLGLQCMPKARMNDEVARIDPGLNQLLVSEGSTISRFFTQDEWERHRGVGRYWRHLFSTCKSTIFLRILETVIWITLSAAALCAYNLVLVPKFSLPTLTIPPIVHQLSGSVLSLSLVFRTNNANRRVIDARSILGKISKCTRDLTRMCMYIPNEGGCRFEILNQLRAFPYAFEAHVRKGRTRKSKKDPTAFKSEPLPLLTRALGERDARRLLERSHENVARQVLLDMSTILQRALTIGMSTQMHQQCEIICKELSDCLANAEKILYTPIPIAYTRHTSRSLTIWLLTLPLALWSLMGMSMIPSVFLIAYLMLGVDEIGIEIEEPFCVLPVRPIAEMCDSEIVNSFDQALAAPDFKPAKK